MKKLIVILAVVLIMVSASTSAYACMCAQIDLDESVKTTSTIFSGKVVSSRIIKQPYEPFTFKIELVEVKFQVIDIFKGDLTGKTVTVITPVQEGTCGISEWGYLSKKDEWLIYAESGRVASSPFSTNSCTRTAPTAKNEDIAYLKSLKNKAN